MKKSSKKALKIGAGVLTAAALAGAGAYMMSGKSGKERKAKIKAIVAKAKKDVAAKMKTAKKLSAAEYGRFVDMAIKRYGSLQNAGAAEIMMATQDLKAEWNHMQTQAKRSMKPAKIKTKKAMKRMAKKKRAR